jgi:hypothetical protein
LDRGGWRYLAPCHNVDADLSVTSWQLMFWRSAKNAGFDVPSQWVDESLDYVKRSYDEKLHIFYYALHDSDYFYTRGMTGAGVLALSLGGLHDTPMARGAGDWLLQHPFDRYLQKVEPYDRFFYGAFYCSEAMYQLGGHYWEQFYPTLVDTFLSAQHEDGSWDPDTDRDQPFGKVYTAALVVLALTPENQLLPIFQR